MKRVHKRMDGRDSVTRDLTYVFVLEETAYEKVNSQITKHQETLVLGTYNLQSYSFDQENFNMFLLYFTCFLHHITQRVLNE